MNKRQKKKYQKKIDDILIKRRFGKLSRNEFTKYYREFGTQ